MTKPTLILSSICWISLFHSCSPNYSDDMTDTFKEQIVIENYKDSNVFFLSNFVAANEFIALQDTSECQISNIDKIMLTNDEGYIVFDGRGCIARFDASGKYLNKIGSCGHGHGEYLSPNDVTYDPYNDQVLVFDRSNATITYSLDGTFLGRKEETHQWGRLAVLDKDHYCYFKSYYLPDGLDSDYNFEIVDKEQQVKLQFELFERPKRKTFLANWNNIFSRYGNGVICKAPNSDKMYYLHDGKAEGLVQFIVKSDKDSDNEEADEYLELRNMHSVTIENVHVSDKYIFADINSEPIGHIIKNRITGELHIGRYSLNIVSLGSPNFLNVFEIRDSKMFTHLRPENFNFVTQNLRNAAEREKCDTLQPYIDRCERLSKNVNPIIQVCKLK